MEQTIIQTLNSQSRNMQVDVRVITLDDNLFHPYFTSIDVSKDNLSPIGIAKAETVYANDIFKYWTKYTGTVIISFNMKETQHINTNSKQYAENNELPQRLTNDEYNYSLICKISKLRHKGKKIIIYFEDLGWKFLQKVPSEFRQTFIAGQPLDKAFQAICEFLEVDFAYSIKDLQEYNFGADGYSVEKDGTVIEDVETILSEQNAAEEEENQEEEINPLDQEGYENPSLIEYDNEHKNDENYVRNDKQNNKQLEEKNEEEDKELEKQQEEFDKKIINLFIGNTYYESNLTSNVMDYGKITITPTQTDVSSDSSGSSIESSGDGSNSENTASQYGQSLLNNADSGVVLGGVSFKKTALSYSEINKMTPKQALHEASKTNTYYYTTIVRLRARAAWGRKIDANTDYSKYYY